MKNLPKAGLLIVTLVIPALIFVFLEFFATNHYDLPYFNPELDAHGKVIIEKGDTLFRKVNVDCAGVERANIENKLTVISNLLGDCKGDCQIVMAQLRRISALRSEIPELGILTLATSEKSDSVNLPEEVGKKGWDLLVVSRNTIDSCFYQDRSVRLKLDSDVKDKLILVDKSGYIRGYYKGSDASETDRLMAEIKVLNYEEEKSVQ